MSEEDKSLLLKDLCARLPYGVIVHTDYKDVKLDRNHRGIGMLYYEHYSEEAKKQCGYNENDFSIILSGCYYGDNIKPYLRPMSSMTEEERKYISDKCGFSTMGPIGWVFVPGMPIFAIEWLIDFYNSNHFDYRGLIEKGLAIAVTEENNPYAEDID